MTPSDHPGEETASHVPWSRLMRARYDRHIILQMEDGSTLSGPTRDLNAKGCFVHADVRQYGVHLIGMKGSFFEELHGEKVTISCQVVRVTEQGVGVQFIQG